MQPTYGQQIAYRILGRDEIEKLREIDRREIVDAVYYLREGKLLLTPEHWEIPGFGDIDRRVALLTELYADGGMLFGAFDGATLVGMSVLENRLRGADHDRMQMSGLWVSHAYRRRGIARCLVDMAKSAARCQGASYLYISATPSENTISFYLGIGCTLTAELDPELVAREPDDIHFDLMLS